MDASSIYELTKLHESEIRVLHLHPSADETAPLSGCLGVQQLGDNALPDSTYEALSYAWGDPTPVSSISIGRPVEATHAGPAQGPKGSTDPTDQGHGGRDPTAAGAVQSDVPALAIAYNLEVALRHLRPTHGAPRRLWIDAVCIDQVNDAEKSTQVSTMGDVFGNACRMLVWLGPASSDSAEAMHFVAEIASRWRDEGQRPAIIDWLKKVNDSRWQTLRNLLIRPLWSRLWVVQEIIKSREPVALCGREEVPLDYFCDLDLVDDVSEPKRNFPLNMHPFSHVLARLAKSRRTGSSVQLPLLNWVASSTQCICSQRRDRLYALLSISEPADRIAVPINYDESQLSDQLLYVKTTMHFLSRSGTLAPLEFGWRKEMTGLPSWTPD